MRLPDVRGSHPQLRGTLTDPPKRRRLHRCHPAGVLNIDLSRIQKTCEVYPERLVPRPRLGMEGSLADA